MIKTPQAQRKRRFKTESGYKLRGAMIWVVVGIVSGLTAALLATGLLLLWTKYFNTVWDPELFDCAERPVWMYVFDGLRALVVFFAVSVVLFFLRRSVTSAAEQKYGDFASDIGDWFGFGALIAMGVFGVPLWFVAVFTNVC